MTRPRATAFGEDAYPDLETKAAALLHSVVNNRALVDGSKRLGLAATTASLGLNGRRLAWTNDQAYDVVAAVAAGEMTDPDTIAAEIGDGSTDWKQPRVRGRAGTAARGRAPGSRVRR